MNGGLKMADKRKVLCSYQAKHSGEITIRENELIEVFSEGKTTE